jgi:hypothetical protein
MDVTPGMMHLLLLRHLSLNKLETCIMLLHVEVEGAVRLLSIIDSMLWTCLRHSGMYHHHHVPGTLK